MLTLWQDLRYGLRLLAKSRGFTALAVLALALGIGANTAIFSVANAFLRKPVSFPQLDRLVAIQSLAPEQTVGWNGVSPADYLDWKRQSRSFEQMAAIEESNVNLTGNAEPERVLGSFVSANYFDVLRVKPAMGRAFLPEEEQPGHNQEAILSHSLWQRHFASDPGVLGKTVALDGKSSIIVGVMSKEFDYPPAVQLWLPLALDAKRQTARDDHSLDLVGRLKPGVSFGEARAELETIESGLQQQFPKTDKDWEVKMMPLRVRASGELADEYCLLLMAAVGFVLLIACANVANLQFARSASRQREIALRQALGASRLRVVRQLLTESILMAVAGAGLGLLLAEWGIELTLYYMPPEVEKFIPAWKHIRLDNDAFFFTVGITLLAGLISGLAPAFQSSKPDINEELKEGGRSSTAGRARQRLRSAFVVVEVALSLVLLVGAGLMAKGVRALLDVNRGLSPEKVLTMRINLPESKYKTPQQQASFYDQVLRRFETIPGAQAAIVTTVPFGENYNDAISIQGRPARAGELRLANHETVSSGYFRMMKIPLLQGRLLGEQDGAEAPGVAVISESLAQRYFPGEDPLGKIIKRGQEDSALPWLTIVGVVGDIKYDAYERKEAPPLYVSYRQAPDGYSYIAIRTEGEPMAFAAAVRSRIASVDPEQPVFDVQTLEKLISNQVLGLSYVAVLLSVLGIIALILASIGVYSVMAYSVTERTHEIGVRIALGAQRRDVLRLVLGRGVILTSLGLVIGLPLSLALARLVASLFFGVGASDMITFGAVTLLMTVIALLACYVPARQAMSVDPILALRHE
jgi:putative ABC transport system permease protein